MQQYYRDEPNESNDTSESYESKIKITRKTPDDGSTKNFKIAVPLKYLSNLWKTLETSLINCKVNIILTWSADYAIYSAKFSKIDYFPVVTLNSGQCKTIATIENRC